MHKFNVNVIKTAHRRSNSLRTIFSQEIFANRFKKKSVVKFPEFLIWKMLFAFLQKPCQCSHANGEGIVNIHFYELA